MNADPLRLIVVDDSKDSAEAMAALLRLSGYEVRISHDGGDALALIEESKPHCVLFDVVMPGIGGDELCSRVRALYGDEVVLIGMSGYSAHDPRVGRSFSLADHFLTKPVEAATLTKLLSPFS